MFELPGSGSLAERRQNRLIFHPIRMAEVKQTGLNQERFFLFLTKAMVVFLAATLLQLG